MEYDIAIIGAGAAGIEAALSACRAGLNPVLISDLPIGGRTAYADMVPARIWKESGKLIQQSLALTGIFPFEYRPTINEIKDRIEAAGDDWSVQEYRELTRQGVQIIDGTAIISGIKKITVSRPDMKNITITAKAIIACTGTAPALISGIAPDGERILYPKQLKSMANYPETMIIIGGTTAACEYASALSDLMVEVTLICEGSRITDGMDQQISDEMVEEFRSRGVTVELNKSVRSVELRGKTAVAVHTSERTFTAHTALICSDRNCDYSFLTPKSPQPARDSDGKMIRDLYGRTSLPWLYLAGALCGNASITFARTSAQQCVETIASELAGELPRPAQPPIMPQLISTTPPMGFIGNVDIAGAKVLHFYYSQLPLARIRQITGHLKLRVDQFGKIEAAAMFGEGTEEVLGIISLAMNVGISYGDLARLPLCSPSVSELLSHPPMKVEILGE